jgi:hypothetical protein
MSFYLSTKHSADMDPRRATRYIPGEFLGAGIPPVPPLPTTSKRNFDSTTKDSGIAKVQEARPDNAVRATRPKFAEPAKPVSLTKFQSQTHGLATLSDEKVSRLVSNFDIGMQHTQRCLYDENFDLYLETNAGRISDEYHFYLCVDHPNFVRTCWASDERVVDQRVITEYLDVSLTNIIAVASSHLETEHIRAICSQLWEVIGFSAKLKVSHNGIFPRNIYFRPDGTLKLCE